MPGSLGQVQGNRSLLDWVLLGSGNNSIINYSNESYLEGGKNKEKLKLQLGKRQWLLMPARKWDLGTFVFCTETMVLSVLRQDYYGVVLFYFIHHCHRVPLSNGSVL